MTTTIRLTAIGPEDAVAANRQTEQMLILTLKTSLEMLQMTPEVKHRARLLLRSL